MKLNIFSIFNYIHERTNQKLQMIILFLVIHDSKICFHLNLIYIKEISHSYDI